MTEKELKVIVVARQGADLADLSRHDGPLAAPCGTIGPSVAKAVLSGQGKAEISLLNLKIAMDTQSGVEAIMDNFELYDRKTRAPLLHLLIAQHLKVAK
jgi:hypothetical protein